VAIDDRALECNHINVSFRGSSRAGCLLQWLAVAASLVLR
jgi:hypothetical protein